MRGRRERMNWWEVFLVSEIHPSPLGANWIYLGTVLLEFVVFLFFADAPLPGLIATARAQLFALLRN